MNLDDSTQTQGGVTSGKRFHKTCEFLDNMVFSGIAETQAALDAWVSRYNIERKNQSIGSRPTS